MDIQIATARLGLVQSLSAVSNRSPLAASAPPAAAGPSSVVNLSRAGADFGTGMDRLLAALENRQQLYTNQLSVLGSYRQRIADMGSAADRLAGAASGGDVVSAVVDFARQYNQMVKDYAKHFAANGTFDQLDAAEYARFAMEREVANVFHGAETLGFGGLAAAGISIDAKTRQMSVDLKKLEQTASSNADALRSAVADLASGFKAASEVYTSSGKFIDNRMNRLKDALTWLEANLPAVRAAAGSNGALANEAPGLPGATPAARAALRVYASTAAT